MRKVDYPKLGEVPDAPPAPDVSRYDELRLVEFSSVLDIGDKDWRRGVLG